MAFMCRICGNSDNNTIHEAREMMFGTREEFDYAVCGDCGTLQIVDVPANMGDYYPSGYFAFDEGREIEIAADWKRRIASRFAGDYFLHGRNPIGKIIAEKKPWIKDHFPDSLAYPPLKLDFDSRILDFGCGAGRLLQTLHYFGFRDLTGADAFIEQDISYPTGVNIYKRPFEELEPSFDLVMLHHSFEHLPGPLDALKEIHRLLGDGKYCLLRVPVVNYAWEKYGVNWVQLDPPRHLFLYTEKSMRLLAGQAGFEVEEVVYDSGAFQFWGSEQYLQDIPLNDPRTYNSGDISKTIFTPAQIEEWQREAEELNTRGRGDQACFYLRKSG
jgi:SAM-dependent methyltransferase